jgi:flagellar hook protein FlgE
MYSGLSGLDANGTALSVIGNNIANVNTVGFKLSDVAFEDVLGAAMTTTSGQVGLGVSVGDIISSFTQGAFEATGSATDMAISGNGFFVVNDGVGNYYTRAGQFIFDANGNLTNPQGMLLQGWVADPAGTIDTTGQPTNLGIGSTTSPPSATTSFNLDMNLNADAADGDTFSSTIEAYDSKGGKVTLTVDFTYHQADPTVAGDVNEWRWTATSPDGTAAGSGSFQFGDDGQLIDPADQTITVTGLSNGAADMTMTWDVVDDTGASSITAFASASTLNAQSQNGYGVGTIQGVSVDGDGVISGFFSNGQTRNLGQVALADFQSPWGLKALGEGIYASSLASGGAAVGIAGEGGRGEISSGALELSNVDLAREFVKMITAQRGFQASSRVITTSDEVLTDVINLKR